MLEDIKEVLITEEEIARKVEEMAALLSEEYRDKNPLVICILKGAAFFMTDLIKKMPIELEMDFMDVSSYGNQAETTGEVKIIKDLNTSVQGRHVLLVEDIVDSGLTLKYVVDLLHHRKAKSVKVVTLLDKPHRRKVLFKPDMIGFEVPNEFVVGYGLDYAEKYRNLPFIGVLKREVYTL